jgi:hypothetical protein
MANEKDSANGKLSAEALLAHLPIDEVKRVLTDRFAREVEEKTWRRLLRPITFLGLPGLAIFGTLLWNQLSNSVTTQIAAQKSSSVTEISNQLDAQMQRLFGARSEVARLEARTAIDSAFQGAQGAALTKALADATQSNEFTAQLRSLVSAAMNDAWTDESPQLRGSFLNSLKNDSEFREGFARDVEQVLSREQAVPRIIAGALQLSCTLFLWTRGCTMRRA